MLRVMGFVCAIVPGLLSGGCGTSPPVISVTPLRSDLKYLQNFTQAYTTQDAAGDYQIVLVHDPVDDIPSSEAGQRLNPATVPPVRQYLQIRVLWRPVRGARADTPAATNAALHWYVLEGPTVSGTGMIHYAGTGFVSVVKNGPGAEVIIRNGTLKLAERRGDLVDPLHEFRVDGKFDAVSDDVRVRQMLADVKEVAAEQNKRDMDSGTMPTR